MNRKPKVAIIGAGLGGLAAAGAILRAGCEVTVFEQSGSLGEVGAGINLTPNVLNALRLLDLEAGVLERAFHPENHVFRDWRSGGVLFRAHVKSQYLKNYGAPACNIHRADLHSVLRSGVPESVIRLEARLTGLAQTADGVVLDFADGTQQQADIVIGADGIRSSVRRCLFGEREPVFTGNVAWRFTVRPEDLPRGFIAPDITNWLGPGGHVVHYYVRAGALVNVVAIHETDTWTEESWALRADPGELEAQFAGWNGALFRLFEHATPCFKWGLFDHAPLERWTVGRASLLGDAAHPMLPFLGAGAGMAIEDGVTLGLLLSKGDADPVQVLRRYEALRLARTARVQLGSRARAKENHLRSPLARLRRNVGFRFRQWFQPDATLHRADWIYRYDIERACGGMDADGVLKEG